MEDSRRTYSVLVVAAAAKFHISLREMLPEDRYDPVCAAGSVSEARRALLERPFDIVVISTAHGSACGVWRKRLPPSRNAWRRYGW